MKNNEAKTNTKERDTLGSVNFVAADGHEINIEGVDINVNLADGLSCVCVEEHAVLPAELADLCQWLDDADLVVDGHDRDEGGCWLDGGLECLQNRISVRPSIQSNKGTYIQVDLSVLLHRQVGDFKALRLEGTARVEDALVLLFSNRDTLSHSSVVKNTIPTVWVVITWFFFFL